MNRYYEDGEIGKIYRTFNEGGTLYFIERTDTNQFYYEPLMLGTSNDHYIPDKHIAWSNKVLPLGAFLTRESAEKENNFTQSGCRYCGHGSNPIPTIITEHEFIS